LNIKSQADVCRYLKQTRVALMKDFVSDNIGADALSRKDWLSHNSFISKQLLESKDDELILVVSV
jgi:hypothetical protein